MEETVIFFFFCFFFGHAAQVVNFPIFHEALINIVRQTRLTFDLEIRDNPTSLFRSGQGDISVGDSISIHVLGREWLLVVSYGLPPNPVQIRFFACWETIESCLSFLHTSRQKCFQQKSDRRPPQITGCRVSTVHQGRGGAHNQLATFRGPRRCR